MNQIFSFWGEDFVSLLSAETKWRKKNLAKGLDSLVVVLNIFVSVASLLVAFVWSC